VVGRLSIGLALWPHDDTDGEVGPRPIFTMRTVEDFQTGFRQFPTPHANRVWADRPGNIGLGGGKVPARIPQPADGPRSAPLNAIYDWRRLRALQGPATQRTILKTGLLRRPNTKIVGPDYPVQNLTFDLGGTLTAKERIETLINGANEKQTRRRRSPRR